MNNKKINILFIHPYKHSVGPNVVLLNLVKYLDKDKFNFFVVLPDKINIINDLEENQAKILFLPALRLLPRTYNPFVLLKYFLDFSKSILKLKKIIKNNQIDIIHISTPAAWPFGFLKIICKRKCVFHAQELTSMKPKFIGLISSFFLNFFADSIICVSQAVRDAWQKVGVSPKKLIVIYNGIDLEKFKPLPENEYSYLKKELNLENKYPIIGMIAALDLRKGHDYFVEAAFQIKKFFPQAFFLIVGPLNLPKQKLFFYKLERLIRKYHLSDSILFLNERKDIVQIINLCDLIIIPSRTEAGSLTAIEVQACAKPLIASDIGGLPEYSENNKTGYLFSVGEIDQAVSMSIQLLRDKNLARTMGQNGRKFVEKFKIQDKIKEIENLYFSLLR